jgi:hypothetical protein
MPDSRKGLVEVAEEMLGRSADPELAQELAEAEREGGWVIGGLWPGDRFEHAGQFHTCTAVDEHPGLVTMRDGVRFLEPRVTVRTDTPKKGTNGTKSFVVNPYLIVAATLTDEHFNEAESIVKDQATGGGGWY